MPCRNFATLPNPIQLELRPENPMPEIVDTHLSFFEAEIEFVQPNLRIWLDRIAIVEAVYDALRQWGITVDDVEVIQTGKPSEQGVKFKVPDKRVSFFFSAGLCRFSRDSTSWQTAQETIEILDVCLKAFRTNAHIEFKTFKTAVALHVQPRTKPFFDVLKPLIPKPMEALGTETSKALAIVVKWPDRRVTIDGSAQIANGIFIRYEHDFPAEAGYEAMAKQLYADEMAIMELLDIKEEE
jgi:hypothetical protein